MDIIKVCTSYDGMNGPLDLANLNGARPVYEEWPGWKQTTRGITQFEKLPAQCKTYLARLAEIAESDLYIVSTGPRRDETIFV
jgi:adenylosuccinate synthase